MPSASAKAAIAHLKASDPVLAGLMEVAGSLDLHQRWQSPPVEPYGALVRSIVGQQLSTIAAGSIYRRLLGLFGGRVPGTSDLLGASQDDLRAAGLSRPKIAYLKDLAAHIEDGRLKIDKLGALPDDEVARELTAVKGLGQWTADMFLLFHLGRPDVLPVGDLGIRRAVERAYGLSGLPSATELATLATPWQPHRSVACLYLWQSLGNNPAAGE